MKKTWTLKITSIILCISILIGVLPSYSFANSAESPEVLPPSQAGTTEPEIINEAVEYRDEYSKSFLRDDGTYVAISTGEALHYQDKDGEWQDIDNTLITTKDDDGNDIITNTAAEFKAELPATIESDKTVTMEKGDYNISFKLLTPSKISRGKVTNNKEPKLSKEEKKQAKALAKLEKKSAKLDYNDVFTDTDIEYEVKPKGIKESIILKAAPKKPVNYEYEITAKGLTAKLLDDNSIEFYASGKETPEFIMPAPYMFDNAEEAAYSNDVAVTLKDLGDGIYRMTYTPNLSWMQSTDRIYPITIDPTLQTTQSTSNVSDAMVKNGSYVATKYGSSNEIEVNVVSPISPGPLALGLIKFNSLPNIQGCMLTKATMKLFSKSEDINSCNVSASRITSYWDENTVTYNTMPSKSSIAEDVAKGAEVVSLDLTRLVNDWMINGNNYGVMLDSIMYSKAIVFHSSENGDVEKIPCLEMEFAAVQGLDTRFDMHTFNVGRAGTVYINDFTGNLMYERLDMSFDGNVMPAEIKVIYDKSIAIDPYSSGIYGSFGYDYKISYNNPYYILKLPNNKRLFFEEKNKEIINDGAGNPTKQEIWKSDGYELTVTDNTKPPLSPLHIEIKTPDNQKLIFGTTLFAEKIIDLNNPAEPFIEITRTGSGIISTIKDGSGRVYRYNRSAPSLVSSIDYLGTGSTPLSSVAYSFSGDHIATYPDGKSVSSTFVSSNLETIKDVDGYKLKFTYTTGTSPRVSKVEEFAPDGTAGDWLTIDYGVMTTTFTDSRGHKEIKSFDYYGNTISVRDENGYAVFSIYDNGDDRHRLLGNSEIQIPGENNLISNWKFDNMSASGWTGGSLLSSCNAFPGVSYAQKTMGLIYTNQYIKTRVTLDPATTGKAGTVFSYGGWGRTQNGSQPTGDDRSATFGMKVEFTKTSDVATDYKFPSFNFNYCNTNWQYQKDSFTLPCDVSYIEVFFVFGYQSDTAYFTGAELQNQSLYYTTDTSGNIIQNQGAAPADPTDPNAIDFSKTIDDEIVKDASGNTVSTIKRSVSAAGVGSSYTYDKYGNLTAEAVTNGTVSMGSQNTYTASGNHLASTTDPLGNTTTYNYNQNLGTLDSVTDANSKTTSYTYDNMQRLKSVSQPVSSLTGGTALSNSYTYDGDRLKTITHNGFNYTFNYDKWGNQSSVLSGTQTLVTNTYKDNIGKLLDTVTFGNSQTQKYTYDTRDRLTGIKFNGDSTDRFTYIYNLKNDLTDKKDFQSSTWTKYKDGKTSEYALDGTTLKHSYVRDGDQFIEQFATAGKTFTYNFKSNQDGKPSSVSYDYAVNKTAATENRYDNLGRITNQGVTANNNQIYWTNVMYRDQAGFKTSDQVYAVDYSFGAQSSKFNNILSYTYDALGNITSISKNGAQQYGYTYDEAGQLTRVNDAVQNKSFTYTYDVGGNIRERKEYTYSTGTLSGTPVTVTYAYGDANWKDKLTSYSGKAITYDNIGNPLTYDGWTYAWEGGRQLKSAVKTGTSASYKYNDEGIRTSKTVGGLTTAYTVIGGKITSETFEGVLATYYRYDEDDNLIAMGRNGAEYFYVKNIQGDIVGIVDATGNVVVEYTYDAWGKQTSCTGMMASTIGASNPFRYRGYYFDNETGLYYLQSRYYNPEWGRFVNADGVIDEGAGLLSTNLFQYCANNPVMHMDESGCSITSAIKSGAKSFWNGFTDHFKGYYYLVSSLFSDPLGVYFNYIKSPWNWFTAAKLMKMQVTDVVNIWKAVFSKNYNKLGYIFGEKCAIAFEMLIIKMSIKALGKVIASINSGSALKFTKHGADQAFGRDGGRGVSDSAIRNTIKNPTKVTPQPKNGTVKLEGSQAVVVLNQSGEIVTTWAKSSKYYRK